MVASNGNGRGYTIPLIAGGVAGGVEAAVTYPFESAKTRAQLPQAAGVKPQTNPFLAVRDTVRHEGWKAMYRGCGALVVGSMGKDAVRFMAFDSIKQRFADPKTGSFSLIGNMMAGVVAGIAASTAIVTPSERIKTALIDTSSSTRQFHSTTHAICTIFKENGIRGLYCGYIGTTLKQTGTTTFRLGSYNTLKDIYRKYDIPPGRVLNLVTGATAGLITALATQPFDVIKTRAQSAQGTTTTRAVKDVFLEKGIRGFWAGTTMRLSRTVFSGAILFSVYENTASFLRAAGATS